MRDCLHEEFAQALGPLNDLYRLPNSVFNDDNVHTVLTSFDMLILKITYAPSLKSGMSRTQVQARLPAILKKLIHAEPRSALAISKPRRGTGSIWYKPRLARIYPLTGAAKLPVNLYQSRRPMGGKTTA